MSSSLPYSHQLDSSDLQSIIHVLLPQLEEHDTAVVITHLPRLRKRLEHLKKAFKSDVQHSIAIKSHPHIELLKVISQLGFGLEAASIEEVRRALKAGCPSERIVFDSPVKTRQELAEVAQLDGLLVNVNSLIELARIPMNARCTIGIRINPEIHTGSPELFSVGRNESKFGVPLSTRKQIIDAVLTHPVRALHMHSGSQMRDLNAQEEALNRLVTLARELNQALEQAGKDRRINILDIGGGLPTEALFDHENHMSNMQAYAQRVEDVEGIEDFKLITEFGQWVNAECGIALSRVEYVLDGDPLKLFIHLGADFFTRDAYTSPRPFPLSLWTDEGQAIQGPQKIYDIAGPLCFAGDYLARGVQLPKAQEGVWLAIDHVGANTYSLWSRHCSRDVPAIWAWDGQVMNLWSPRRSIDF